MVNDITLGQGTSWSLVVTDGMGSSEACGATHNQRKQATVKEYLDMKYQYSSLARTGVWPHELLGYPWDSPI